MFVLMKTNIFLVSFTGNSNTKNDFRKVSDFTRDKAVKMVLAVNMKLK